MASLSSPFFPDFFFFPFLGQGKAKSRCESGIVTQMVSRARPSLPLFPFFSFFFLPSFKIAGGRV